MIRESHSDPAPWSGRRYHTLNKMACFFVRNGAGVELGIAAMRAVFYWSRPLIG
jgi:hypothetical protein